MKKPKSGHKFVQVDFRQIIEIPKEWEVSKLELLVKKMRAGGTPDTKNKTYYDGEIPFVRIIDITSAGKFIEKTINTITEDGLEDSSAWLIPKNSILFSMYASIGKITFNKKPLACHQGILGIIIDERKTTNEFLYYALEKTRRIFPRYYSTGTQSNLNLKICKSLKIIHPKNIDEAKKIGSILSNIDELIQKQQQVIEQTQKLKKGQMQKLLTSGLNRNGNLESISPYGKQFQTFSIPKTWKVKKLEKLCQMITDGSHFSPGKDGEYPLATVENMSDGKIDVDSCYKIHKSDYEYLVKNNCQPKNNDVLFSKDGTIGLCLVYTQPDKIVVLSSIAIIRTKPDELDPNFLKYILKSRYMQVYLAKFKSGTALKRIILKNISEFTFPLPPTIKEQQKIASILSNLDLLIQQEKQYKEKLEKIKRGLMQQLLTGKTRVKV